MPKCEHCQQTDKSLYRMKGVLQNGMQAEVNLCYECSYKFMQGTEWFHSPYGLIKSGTAPVKVNNDNLKSKNETGVGFWASIVKIANFLVVIVLIVIGILIGSSIGDEGGAVIGGLAGLVVGVVIVSMSMLFVEISQKLSILIDEVKKIQ